MKTFCALATLAAATAVENTAPVISLSLDTNDYNALDHDKCGKDSAALAARNTDSADASHCVEYDAHTTAATAARTDSTVVNTYSTSHPHSFAAKGLVGATKEQFPEPTASAYDHHDESNVDIVRTYTYFVVSRPACHSFTTSSITTKAEAMEAGTVENNGVGSPSDSPAYSGTTHVAPYDAHTCAMKQFAADIDVTDSTAPDGEGFTTEMRARRGEFIIKYDATDRAGNQASQLVFAMILVDDECPCPVGPALVDVEAMDSCDAVLPYKEGKDTECNSANIDRSKIVLDEKQISWKDNYDGFSPTLANADWLVRAHGLSYSVTHNHPTSYSGSYVLESNHGSASDIAQAVYLMADSHAVSVAGTTTVEYTTKDYANIFGYNYADNSCTTGSTGNQPAHCTKQPDTAWVIKDSLPPRIFANPNLEANDAGIKTDTGVAKSCGAAISGVPAFTDGRDACHSWNLRRRWCATSVDAADKCFGWSATELFVAGSTKQCTYEDTKAVHECGTAYREPGFVCIDMRDSFSPTSKGNYEMTIVGVNDAATTCNDYHVDTDKSCMHEHITYTQGSTLLNTALSSDITSANPSEEAGRTEWKAVVFGTVFDLATTAQTATGYPLYGKNGECKTEITATYTCTDALAQAVSLTRTIEVTDTVAPTLEIATAGMNIINVQESTYVIGVNTTGIHAHGLYGVNNDDFTDNTNMDSNGVHVDGRTTAEQVDDYVNAKNTNTAGDWHGTHTAADSQKGMNSHYHDKTVSDLTMISNKTVGAATGNFAGKSWTLKTSINDAGVQDSYVIQHSSGFDADEAVITNLIKAHKGFACYDECDGDLTHAMTDGSGNTTYGVASDHNHGATNGVTMTWHHTDCAGAVLSSGFNTLVPGTYALKYVCQDQCANTASKCRTILNEDHTKPVITVLEADDQTYEATRSDNYVDAGATCSDEVDGNISQDVEVSGDVVNLARVGVYTIKYNCEDSASNTADEATRKVTVQDTSCPTCVLSVDGTTATTGATTSIEASFPYSDVGAVAQDTLQGSFGICSVWSEGTMKASYKDIVNVEATGTYYITYRVKDSNGNWNDDNECSEGQTGDNLRDNIRTVVIIDTLRPVIELKYKGSATDAEQVIHRGAQEFTDGRGGAPRGDGDVAGRAADFLHQGAVHQADLHNRQVAGDHSVQRTTTTENHYTYTPSLMAEESATTAVNGWVIGAVASAVSGLALLGYSLRKSAAPVATSVPV